MAQDAPQTDTLYSTYGKDLYRTTGEESENAILDMLQPQPGADNSSAVETSASDVGSGTSTSTASQAVGSQQSGKTTFDNTVPGYILGFDPKDGNAKFYIGNSTKYINWDGSTLTIVGGVSVTSLDIPDTTTANSFHTDSNGNSWWGANVATGYATAPASILATGAATFSDVTITGGSLSINGGVASIDATGAVILKSVKIGGSSVQYTVNDFGLFNYGDGQDGSAHITSNATLTSDKYYTDLTIDSAATLNPGGYRIFVSGTLTLGGASAGTIDRSGNSATNGGNGVSGGLGGLAGAGGAALSDGYLKGAVAGPNGSIGSQATTGNGGAGSPNVAPTSGASTSNSIGSSGVTGGTGGSGSGGSGGGGGSLGNSGSTGGAGTATPSNVRLIANWHLATLLDISSTGSSVKFDNSAGAGAGGGGGAGGGSSIGAGANSGPGGGGGGAGSGGAIVAIYARNIVINANGNISANGGNGGNGGNAANANGTGGFAAGGGGGGGGGSGGNGGQVILVYNTLTGAGIANITATAGTGGTGGNSSLGIFGGGAGGNGSAGSSGTAGNVRQFQLSL